MQNKPRQPQMIKNYKALSRAHTSARLTTAYKMLQQKSKMVASQPL